MEAADFRSMRELFVRGGDEKTLDNFISKFESDLLEYALISHKLRLYEVIYLVFYLISDAEKLSLYWPAQGCDETVNDVSERGIC